MVLSRYAACPFCSLRVDRLIRHHAEIAAAGIELAVLFPSPPERIETFISRYDPPFETIADPEETAYAALELKTSWAGELKTAVNVPKVVKALLHAPNNPFAIDGPIHRMPAEFLVRNGTIEVAHYGSSLDDGIPVEVALSWAKPAA